MATNPTVHEVVAKSWKKHTAEENRVMATTPDPIDQILRSLAKRVEKMPLGKTYGWDDEREALLAWRDSEVLKAQINMVEYYDQTPTNEGMDWKGLFADNLAELRYEYGKLDPTNNKEGDN